MHTNSLVLMQLIIFLFRSFTASARSGSLVRFHIIIIIIITIIIVFCACVYVRARVRALNAHKLIRIINIKVEFIRTFLEYEIKLENAHNWIRCIVEAQCGMPTLLIYIIIVVIIITNLYSHRPHTSIASFSAHTHTFTNTILFASIRFMLENYWHYIFDSRSFFLLLFISFLSHSITLTVSIGRPKFIRMGNGM